METLPSRFKGNRPGVQSNAGEPSEQTKQYSDVGCVFVRFWTGTVCAYRAGYIEESPCGITLFETKGGNRVAIIPNGTAIIEIDPPQDIQLSELDEMILQDEREDKRGFFARLFNW